MPVGRGGGVEGTAGGKNRETCNSFTLSRVQGARPKFGASIDQIN